MPAQLNHTVVAARDASASAAFLCEILDLPAPQRMGPFHVVSTTNGVSLDYAQVPEGAEVVPQHYAFLIDEVEFDRVYYRVVTERGLDIWADPRQTRPGEINTDHGRGFYFLDPSGHYLEVLTEPYTAW